jgi:hypothetical protein
LCISDNPGIAGEKETTMDFDWFEGKQNTIDSLLCQEIIKELVDKFTI